MSTISVGDMAQQFTSLRNGGAIKTDLARLAESLSTGKVADITKQLNGATTQFSALEYTLTQLDGYDQAATETGQLLANIQTVLSQVDNTRGRTAERLLLVNESSTIAQVDEAASSARNAFETAVRALNTQLADRALLGGADVDGPPLAPADDMLSDLRLQIGAITDPAAITGIVDLWFEDPAGGFATIGYLGDTGPFVEKRISETKTLEINARADDSAIVEVLKGAALAALASDVPALDRETKVALLQTAGERLFAASSDLISVQARIGFSEAGVDQTLAETAAQIAALGITKNNTISADPFETATRLQAVQLQLETHFSVTARLSQLSLLRFI